MSLFFRLIDVHTIFTINHFIYTKTKIFELKIKTKFLIYILRYDTPFWKKLITFFCYINFCLLTSNTFSCNNTFLLTPNYFLCNVRLFVSTQNYFSYSTKFLFWTSFRMLCHGDKFLLSHSNKNIITCKKINKISFLCDTKKLISFFIYLFGFLHQFVYIQFLHYTLSACWSSS